MYEEKLMGNVGKQEEDKEKYNEARGSSETKDSIENN